MAFTSGQMAGEFAEKRTRFLFVCSIQIETKAFDIIYFANIASATLIMSESDQL